MKITTRHRFSDTNKLVLVLVFSEPLSFECSVLLFKWVHFSVLTPFFNLTQRGDYYYLGCINQIYTVLWSHSSMYEWSWWCLFIFYIYFLSFLIVSSLDRTISIKQFHIHSIPTWKNAKLKIIITDYPKSVAKSTNLNQENKNHLQITISVHCWTHPAGGQEFGKQYWG